MTGPVAVTFDGQSSVSDAPCFLRVTLLNRPYGHIAEPWDREVIDCEVRVDADAFKGHYASTIWGHELVVIRAVLAALSARVGQEAEGFIDLLENAFAIKFMLTPLGHLTMEIVARGHPGMGPELHFSMEADQSYLPLWIKQLDEALAAFPAEVPVDVSDPLRFRGPEPVRE
ncbi:MAG: hypothetical protein DLM70_02035 [Chloroflexi bacterium]|nr:MAG: hypothetical protein DLM70_02035 [Chloroflexota bacterium]